MAKNNANIGILTFHCSDNFGAMLQAYGLKKFLCDRNRTAEIVRYEPFYMTGRHWFLPYVPKKGKKEGRWGGLDLWNMLGGLKGNLGRGPVFWKRRANMRHFRKAYLIHKGQKKALSCGRLKSLPYEYYIVGSDQIWNPEITCGLREAYFGAFDSKSRKRVIAYAASFGGTEIAPQYDADFAGLIKSVDAVSMREEAAIPYIKRFYGREVTAVLDPVFLPGREAFQAIEKKPGRTGYILVYITETNQDLCEYVQRLAREKGLDVVEICAGSMSTKAGFEIDYTAGPAEFLGYIQEAEYVVSNSFHAVAFSIIFRKKFLAFLHSNRGARIRNILQIHGLEDRICTGGAECNIDAPVDWEKVARRTREKVKEAEEFLCKNIPADASAPSGKQ